MGLDLSLSQSKNEARKEIYETDCHLLSGGPQTAGDGKEKRLPGEKETGEIWMGRCGEYRFGSAGIMIILRILICSIPLGRQGNGQETLFR